MRAFIRTTVATLVSVAACAAWAQTAVPDTPSTAKPVTTASGLIYQEVVAGMGASPKATDRVLVHYRGTFMDGREFDSSFKRKEPIAFPLNGVIPCWTEGVQKMKIGGRAKLTCPPALAYGAAGAGGGAIPPNATLQFDVELLGINVK